MMAEFRSLVEILLSLPELFFVLNFPTLAKIKSSSVSGPRKLSKFIIRLLKVGLRRFF